MLCLVTALVLQALGAALDKSATWDEPGHLTRGAWILAAGDYGLEFLHPPLAQTLAAALVRLVHAPQVPDDLSQRPNITAAGHAFVWMANPNGHQLIFTARLTTMFLSVVGAILVCLWATELYGWGAGGLALFLYCFCPNIIAHSAVITTDLSCTVFSLAACYAYWRFSQRRSCGRLLALGAALGLALASKYSALFLLPALAAAEVLRILSVRPLSSADPSMSDGAKRRLETAEPEARTCSGRPGQPPPTSWGLHCRPSTEQWPGRGHWRSSRWLRGAGIGLLVLFHLAILGLPVVANVALGLLASCLIEMRDARPRWRPKVRAALDSPGFRISGLLVLLLAFFLAALFPLHLDGLLRWLRPFLAKIGWLPVGVAVALAARWDALRVRLRWGEARRAMAMESFVHLALALLVALGVLWACYGFEVRPASGPDRVPTDVLVTMTHPFGSAGLALQKLSRHAWLPLRSHLSGFVMMRDQQAGTRECYLLGVTARHGWWYYFPVAIAVKTPVPMLILLLLSLALFRRLRREDGFSEVTLLLPVAVMLYFAMRSPINIGLRHVLPIYPLLFVFVSKTARLLRGGRLGWMLLLAALALWYLQSAFSIYPHYLAYFNELAGGPSQGHKFLVDSNLDWGQDLKHLAEFQRRHPEARPLRLAYFGSAPPSAYGVEREPLATGTPVTGWVAASVTLLRLQPDGYDWLKAHRPVATLGYSINVYEIGGRRALE